MRARRVCLGLALLLLTATAAAAEPRIAAIWYRGTPAGIPQPDDLARIRALGFTSVVWPARFEARTGAVQAMGAAVGLSVIVAAEGPVSSLTLSSIDASRGAADVTARAWRALQDGANVIAFDARAASGAGLENAVGELQPWVQPARAFGRQLAANAAFFDEIAPGPAVTVEGGTASPRVTLFQTRRSWLLIATNASARRTTLVARLPAVVPTALWISLLDGSGMSMPRVDGAPRWTADLPAGGALVYIIDRAP